MSNFLKSLKNLWPNEFKRPTSIISYILSGILAACGWWIFNDIILKNIKKVSNSVFDFMSQTFSVNLFFIIAYSTLFIVISRYFDRKFLMGKEGILIFEDKFESIGSGWFLNYWGSNNPSKTNRIENGAMIFEATESELQNDNKEFGAYYNLSNGIFEGNEYEVICKVKSDPGTTMRF